MISFCVQDNESDAHSRPYMAGDGSQVLAGQYYCKYTREVPTDEHLQVAFSTCLFVTFHRRGSEKQNSA